MIIRATDGCIHEVTSVFVAQKQDGTYALCGRVAWAAPAASVWGRRVDSAADLYRVELPLSYEEAVGGGCAICLSDGYESWDKAMSAIDCVETGFKKAPCVSFYDETAYKADAEARKRDAEDMRGMVRRMESINRR